MLIANINQCIQGYRVFQVVRNIQGWVSSVAIHKIQVQINILSFAFCTLQVQ